MVTIRLITNDSGAALEDTQNVRALFIRYGRLYNFEQTDNFFEEIQQLPQPFLPNKGGLLIAYQDQVPVGCLAFMQSEESPQSYRLKRMYVLDFVRRNGIGKSLLEKALEESGNMGGKVFQLEVRNWMDGADELSESVGMQEVEMAGISAREARFYEKEL